MDLAGSRPPNADQKWPDVIWLVRHGQSAGNVARDAAEAAGLPLIDILTRDVGYLARELPGEIPALMSPATEPKF